jgi:hypothetical protein
MADPTPTDLGRRSADLDMAAEADRFLMWMEQSEKAQAETGVAVPPEAAEEIAGRRKRFEQLRDVLAKGGGR